MWEVYGQRVSNALSCAEFIAFCSSSCWGTPYTAVYEEIETEVENTKALYVLVLLITCALCNSCMVAVENIVSNTSTIQYSCKLKRRPSLGSVLLYPTRYVYTVPQIARSVWRVPLPTTLQMDSECYPSQRPVFKTAAPTDLRSSSRTGR